MFARNIKVFTHNCFFLIIIKKNKSPATFFSWNDDGDFTTMDVSNFLFFIMIVIYSGELAWLWRYGGASKNNWGQVPQKSHPR